jgi:muramoyltetrapeptide carboxypeptidase
MCCGGISFHDSSSALHSLRHQQYTDRVNDINFQRPPRLRAGSRVGLIAPAGPVTEERLAASVARCESLGLVPIIGSNAHLREGYLAGGDAARALDVTWAFTDTEIDAVWALRGGYGTMRLHNLLDFEVIARASKPYIGFSDNTYMHLMLARRGLVSFHAPHPGADFPPETEAGLLRVLFGDAPAGMLPIRADDPAPRTINPGVCEGKLIGGNLSLLAALCGTPAQMQAEGCIVFIEDVGETLYRLDRCFAQLDMSGALAGVRGFAFGRFTEPADQSTDEDLARLLGEVAARYSVPAVMNFPIGHIEHNWTVPLGVRAALDADACTLELLEPAVIS